MEPATKKPAISITGLWALLILVSGAARADTPQYVLTPISGADGALETVPSAGKAAVRGTKDAQGRYPSYLYFRAPAAFPHTTRPVYAQFVVRDTGPGSLGVQYNAAGADAAYQTATRGFGRLMTGAGKVQTAVFALPAPNFRHAQNLGADLRLTGPGGTVPLEVVSAALSTQPPALFTQHAARPWLAPYVGPRRRDIDATTLRGKVLCGYQGWFRCPGDPTEQGWGHWSAQSGRIAPDTLSVEMWPDMAEYPPDDQYRAGAFTFPNGRPAMLFSSANPHTVDLHFDWMRKYGIDGVFVQRFLGGLDGGDGSAEAARVLGYARNAANRTGRVFAVEYDMSGTPPDEALARMQKDWRWLVNVMHVTDDPRYLHHNGRPVLAIFGFYPDRFSGRAANKIIDAFQTNGKYGVSLVGAGAWFWRKETDPNWSRAFRRFAAYSPWNVGNWGVKNGQAAANADYWADDLAEARRAGMLYLPVLYPGFSWDNLQHLPPGKSNIPRRGGAFFREQFQTAAKLGIGQAFVAMFDEVDEGTAIFKVTNAPPTQGHFVTPGGQPTDTYLRLTGEGTRLIRGAAGSRK